MKIQHLRAGPYTRPIVLLFIFLVSLMFQTQIVHGQTAAQSTSGIPQFPELTYNNLLRLYIAEYADLLDNPSFAWQYFKVYKAPDRQEMRAECFDLMRQADNPIYFQQLHENAYAAFKEELPRLKKAPTSGTFASPAWVQLQAYDLAREVFPVVAFNLGYNKALTALPRCDISEAPPGPDYAPSGFDNTAIVLPGMGETPMEIPVPREIATKWLNNHTFSRNPQLNAVATVQVHPLPFVSETMVPKIPGEVIGLTVLDPLAGKSFYRFQFSGFVMDEKTAGKASSQSLMTLTSEAAVLYLIKSHPDLLHTDVAEELTRRHIFSEQQYWQNIDHNVRSLRQKLEQGGKTFPPNINKQRLLFAYQWQLLRKSNPVLAQDILAVFMRPDPSWDFYRQEPEFDSRLEAFVETSIFSRKSLGLMSVQELMAKDVFSLARGNAARHPSGEKLPAPEFLLPELAPVMSDFIQGAAQAMPVRLKMDLDLTGKFDAANKRLLLRTQSSNFEDLDPIMPLSVPRSVRFASDGDSITSTLYAPLPKSARNRFVYQLGYLSLPEQPRPSLYKSTSPTKPWRDMVGGSMGLGHLKIGNAKILGLDREVAFTPVTVSQEVVERAIGNRHSAGNFPLTGRVVLDVEGVDVVRLKLKRQADAEVYNGVILAHVSGLELVDENGHLIYAYNVGALTKASEVAKAKEAAEAKAQADADAALAQKEQAHSARRETLRNADAIGIRIGMAVQEAVGLIRKHMDVGWVGELSEKAPGVRSPSRPYNYFQTYVSADGREHLALYWHPAISDRLMAVTRTILLPENTREDAVLSQLKDKYGDDFIVFPPDNASWVWTADYGEAPSLKRASDPTDEMRFRQGQCHATIRSAFPITSFDMIEGEPVTFSVMRRLPDALSTTVVDVYSGKGGTYSDPKWDPDVWKPCGPTVSAAIKSNNLGKTLSVAIFDLAAYGPVYDKALKEKMKPADTDLRL